MVVHFLPVEALLDDSVGGKVTVEVERGGRLVSAELAVQDLHAVSPSSFLESAGGILHGLSYQQARNNSAHVGQVRHTSIVRSGETTPEVKEYLSACVPRVLAAPRG